MSDLDGTWETVTNTPMGQQKATVTLQTDGDSLSGTMASRPRHRGCQGRLGRWQYRAWKVSITSPMPMTLEFSATADGDSISGSVKLGAFGSATFTGTRSAG